MKVVLQKFIADSGLCSRRQAEELIRNRRVFVNGEVAELGMKADIKDDVRVNGRKFLSEKEKVYIILNKPKGYTCTNRYFPGEKNIFELLDTPRSGCDRSTSLERGINARLFVVGRLDKDSRGLVLLTNDGDLAQKITHPKFEHEKEYIVETHCNASLRASEIIRRMKSGVEIGDGDGVVKVKNIRYINKNKFSIILTEGKKRQIRRMFKAIGCEVKDLVRIRIGNLKLENLAEGEFKYIKKGVESWKIRQNQK